MMDTTLVVLSSFPTAHQHGMNAKLASILCDSIARN